MEDEVDEGEKERVKEGKREVEEAREVRKADHSPRPLYEVRERTDSSDVVAESPP